MSLPNHIAIIPDGNRRWAESRLLNPWEGHIEGTKRFWETALACLDLGIPNVTFWGGSYSNLKKRTAIEVNFLFKIMSDEIAKPNVLNKCLQNEAQFKVLGEWTDFVKDKKVVEGVLDLQNKTKHFKKNSLTILFGYDGQREMIAAANSLVKKGDSVNGKSLRSSLWTADLPDVDLVIRTGGEPHWSAGFMMWQTANSQFYFTDILWPDFKKPELKKALVDYERRERRLGK